MRKTIISAVGLGLAASLAFGGTATAAKPKAPAAKHHKAKHKPKPVWWTPPTTTTPPSPPSYTLSEWKAIHDVDVQALIATATAMQTPTDLAAEKAGFDSLGTEATQLLADTADLEAGQPKDFLVEGFTGLQKSTGEASSAVENLDMAQMNQAQADENVALDDIAQSGWKDA